MIDYSPARKEIKAAKRALQSLIEASNFEDMEQFWRDCINHIEKSHTKLLSATSTVKNKFSSTFSKQILDKSNDELLTYVNQARHSDNHSIRDITKNVDSSIGFGIPNGANSVYIEKMTMNRGVITEYSGTPIKVTFTNAHIDAIPVINRGNTFQPPKNHKGNKLLSTKPVELARLAIIFHDEWIEASAKAFP